MTRDREFYEVWSRRVFAVIMMTLLLIGMALVAWQAREKGWAVLKNSFPGKTLLLKLNGGCQRVIGRRLCNNRIRLDTGTLAFATCRIPGVSANAEKEIAFAEWLAARKVPFIHVQAPMGVDLERKLIPTAIEFNGNEQAGRFISELAAGGVEVLDLRPRFAATPDLVERYFYRTDHHWTYDAAFEAARDLCSHLLEMTRSDSTAVGQLAQSRWKRQVLPHWRLGSHGARTGSFFSGVDDIAFYEPRFKMDLTCEDYGTGKGVRRVRGGFRTVTMNRHFMEAPSTVSAGCYGLHPRILTLGCFCNKGAPSDKRILLIADSFGRPFPAYLLPLFKRVDLLDPRHFYRLQRGSICDYIEKCRPDAVVMLINPTSLGADIGDGGLQRQDVKRMFEFGLSR